MNIKTLRKIAKGRHMFPKFGLKKRGRNNFQKFNYYKLEDLIPVDNAICKELNLIDVLNQSDEQNVTLDVYDLEQDDEQEPVRFYIPSCIVNNGNITQGSQEHGNVQTYSWRYLLYQLWAVSDADEIDASKIGINTPLEELPKSTEVSPERANEIAKQVGQYVYDHKGNNSDKSELMNELNRRLREKEITNDEYNEVKKLINKYKS